MKSYSLRDGSNKLIDEATELLIEALRLPKLSDFENRAFVEAFSVKLSEEQIKLPAS